MPDSGEYKNDNNYKLSLAHTLQLIFNPKLKKMMKYLSFYQSILKMMSVPY